MASVSDKDVESTMQGVEMSSEESVSESKQTDTEPRIENASSNKLEEGINEKNGDDDENDEAGEEEVSNVPSAEEVDDVGEDDSNNDDNDGNNNDNGESKTTAHWSGILHRIVDEHVAFFDLLWRR